MIDTVTKHLRLQSAALRNCSLVYRRRSHCIASVNNPANVPIHCPALHQRVGVNRGSGSGSGSDSGSDSKSVKEAQRKHLAEVLLFPAPSALAVIQLFRPCFPLASPLIPAPPTLSASPLSSPHQHSRPPRSFPPCRLSWPPRSSSPLKKKGRQKEVRR